MTSLATGPLRTRLQRTLFMLGVAVGTVLFGPPQAMAGIKCWTNDQGVRECGNYVPPKYSQQQHEEVNKAGIVVKETERAKTKAEIAEEQRQAELKAQKEKARKEQQARDRVLLSTFTTEQDLVLARDSRVQAIDANIKHTQELVGKLQDTLDQLEGQAAEQERGGKAVSGELRGKIADVKRQIAEDQSFIKDRQKEKQEVLTTFGKDLTRYRELKQRQAQQ